mgnify:CR=1 FL=1
MIKDNETLNAYGMNTKENKEFTAQRRDTSVPVGVGSERAGSRRPSSGDCQTSEVGNQASASSQDTGVETLIDNPFARRGKVARTPPTGKEEGAETTKERFVSGNIEGTRDESKLAESPPDKINEAGKRERKETENDSDIEEIIPATLYNLDKVESSIASP